MSNISFWPYFTIRMEHLNFYVYNLIHNRGLWSPSCNKTLWVLSCNKSLWSPSCNKTLWSPSCSKTLWSPSCNNTSCFAPSCNKTLWYAPPSWYYWSWYYWSWLWILSELVKTRSKSSAKIVLPNIFCIIN